MRKALPTATHRFATSIATFRRCRALFNAVLVGCTIGCTVVLSGSACTAETRAPTRPAEATEQPAPRTFEARWFGGSRQVTAGETMTTPSAAMPGRIGIRLPKFTTAPVINSSDNKTYVSENDILLQRGRARMTSAGTMELDGGVAFMRSETKLVQLQPGEEALALFTYPIVIKPLPNVEAGTVGTDWIVYRHTRSVGTRTEHVALIGLVRSSTPGKGVWIQYFQNGARRQIELTDPMTFIEMVDGQPTDDGIRAIRVSCPDAEPACLLGRVLEASVESAKLIDMLTDNYAVPSPLAQ